MSKEDHLSKAIHDLVHELAEMSVEELRELWPRWNEEMTRQNIPAWAQEWAGLAVKLVIEKKEAQGGKQNER